MPDILLSNSTSRSTYTLADLQDRVRGDLELRGSNRVTNDDITRWANEAQDKLIKLTSWNRVVVYLDAVAGQAEYTLPDRALSISHVTYLTRPLAVATIAQLDVIYPYWRTNGSGTPMCYYLRGNAALGFYHTPSVSGIAAFTIDIVQRAPRVSASEDSFYVPVAAEDAIVIYAKLHASIKDASGEGKNRIPIFSNLWNEAVTQLRQQVDDVAEQAITIMGEEGGRSPYGTHRVIFDPFTRIGPG